MTRKEEIDDSCKFEDKRDEYWNKIVPDSKSLWDAYMFGYYAGAEWADKTMIDKAHKVFQEMLVELCPELLGYGAMAVEWENEFRKRLEE